MKSLWKFFTSLKLTVWCLSFAIILVFLGTLAQVQEGLWAGTDRWFNSLLVIRRGGDPWWVPPILPGGTLIGLTLLVNLVASHIKRFQWTAKKFGVHLTHIGIVLFLVGGLATLLMQQESHMRFAEGETRAFSEDHRGNELIFAMDAANGEEEVVAFPEAMVSKGATISHPKLPFTVAVQQFGPNCQIRQRGPAVDTGPLTSTQGMGTKLVVVSQPSSQAMDKRNLPYAVVEIAEGGKSLGTWLLSPWLNEETITVAGREFRAAFRFKRYYHPFTVTLLKTTHEKYRGTEIAKNYQSRVRIDNPARSESREVDIYMNNPLRYGGLTFFQYQMGRDEKQEVGTSALQVVRNPSWITPYLGCAIVGVGMIYQFMFHLVGFVTKRRKAPPVLSTVERREQKRKPSPALTTAS